jgi:hypothetical protein
MREAGEKISREELFRLVWERPMSRLALQYGITGNGLAKICDRLKVPYPPRGWWAKKAAGKKVVHYRLPERDADTPGDTVIRPTPRPPELSAEAKEAMVRAAVIGDDLRVPDRLLKPHAIIAGWIADHDRRLQERRGLPGTNRQYIESLKWTETDRRRHRILNVLFKAAERRGVAVKKDYCDAFLEVQGERINFKLQERHRRERRPRTEEEKKWAGASGRDWVQELKPSGLLTFSIETHVPGLPQAIWYEKPDGRLEDRLGEILGALIAAGPLLVQLRRQREEAEHLRRIEERRRYEEAERKRLDDNRWRRFLESVAQWREAQVAREFIAMIDRLVAAEDGGPEAAEIASWLAWLHDRVEEHDPLHGGVRGVFVALSSVKSWTYPRA